MILFFIIFVFLILFFSNLINIISLSGLILLGTNIIVSSLMVILSKNPLNSLWFFILTILNIAIYGMIIELEFFILIFITLYLGAISIFFLFMIMLLNIKIINIPQNFNLFNTSFIILIIIISQTFLFLSNFIQITLIKNEIITFTALKFTYFSYNWIMYNIISQYLYTYYGSFFIFIGFFLLILMIGVIILTQEDRDLVKKKEIDLQLLKEYEKCIFLKII
jgi:NADH-quinone oxidoreductase subunit J